MSLSLLISAVLLTGSAKNDNCQLERIANLLPYWADKIELEYSRMYDFEELERDNPRHIDQWADANMGDLMFEVVDEMREYANECHVND